MKRLIIYGMVYPIHYALLGFNKLTKFLKISNFVNQSLLLLTKLLLGSFMKLYFGFKVIGRGNIPKGPCLIAANHQSYMDPVVIGVSLWRTVRFISKIENFMIPILGPLIEMGGAFPIDRRGGKTAERMFEGFIDMLKQGQPLYIFPEGTIPGEEDRHRSDVDPQTGLLQGRTGMIRMAVATKSPIVPTGISGSGAALPPEAVPRGIFPIWPQMTRITVKFGKPMTFEHLYEKEPTRQELRDATDKVMMEITKLVDHSRDSVPIRVPLDQASIDAINKFEARLGIKKGSNCK